MVRFVLLINTSSSLIIVLFDFDIKNFVPDYGDLPQINIVDSDEKHNMLNIVLCEHLLRNGNIDTTDSLIKVIKK